MGVLQLPKARDPVLLALTVFGDHVGRGILNKGFTGKLAGDFFDFGFHLEDFAAEPFLLGCSINDAFKRKINDTDVGGTGGISPESTDRIAAPA